MLPPADGDSGCCRRLTAIEHVARRRERQERKKEIVGTTVFERTPPDRQWIRRALAGSRQGSFWLQDARDEKPELPLLERDRDVDVAIVGGGYTGLWTALVLARAHPDARIALVEQNEVGWAASGRNGGFCEASLTHGEENGFARWADEMPELQRLGQQNLDEIQAVIAEEGIECDFERTGVLSVAVEGHQVGWLREWADADAGVEFLDRDAVRGRIHSPAYLAGALEPDEGAMLHPAKLAYGLARAVVARGVDVFEHTPAIGLERVAGRMVVRTPLGDLHADKVVLGTNAFPSLVRGLGLYTVPVYDHVLMTEPLTDEQMQRIGWAGRQGLSDVSNRFHYSRLSADNRILWGGYDATYHFGRAIDARFEESPGTFARLAHNFHVIFPQLADVRFAHRWGGVIDTCSRFCAFFSRSWGGDVLSALGFTGLGVGATHFAATVLVDMLDGADTERTRLRMVRERPIPFPPEPFASIGIGLTMRSRIKADRNHGDKDLLLKTLDRVGMGFDS